jgi:hypothetical protein
MNLLIYKNKFTKIFIPNIIKELNSQNPFAVIKGISDYLLYIY